jgi:hypothetical protein
MKIVASIIFLILCVLLLVFVLAGQSHAQEQERVVTKYKTPEGRAVELVYKPDGGYIVLQITARKKETHEEMVGVLENEAKRLTRVAGKEIPLGGGSSYIFVFTGGFPLWWTLCEQGQGFESEHLTFAQNAEIARGKIKARGTPAPVGKYPDGYLPKQ